MSVNADIFFREILKKHDKNLEDALNFILMP